jgi:hypothetical protein
MFVLLPFAIAFVCAVVWNVSYPRFLARLRVTHPAAWDALGQPPAMSNGDDKLGLQRSDFYFAATTPLSMTHN